MKPRKSIERKLMWVITLSSVIPLVLLGFFSVFIMINSSKSRLNQRLDEVLKASNEILSSTIETQIYETEELIDGFYRDGYFEEQSITQEIRENITYDLFHYLKRNTNVMNLFFVTVTGEVIGTDTLPDIYAYPENKNWGIYRFAQSEQGAFYPNPQDSWNNYINAYSIIHSIEYDGALYGYLILDVSTAYIQSLFSAVKGTSYDYVQFILASNYQTIIYNDSVFKSTINQLSAILQPADKETKTLINDHTIKNIAVKDYNITIYGFIHNKLVYDQVRLFSLVMLFLMAGAVVGAIVIGRNASKSIINPVNKLVLKMKSYKGLKAEDLDISGNDELEIMSKEFDHLIARMERYHESDLEKQDLMRKAEIKSLMSQINPHFINNTLDSIKWKAKLNEVEDIQDIVLQLSVLLKRAMNHTHQFSTLAEEIELVQSYIRIQQFRYGDRLSFMLGIQEEAYHVHIPKLILQPIIENSIIHGIEPSDNPGIIEVSGWLDDEKKFLYLTVADNGVGTELTFEDLSESGIGIKNVNSRIKLHYGNEYGLWWRSVKGKGTVVFIKIPMGKEDTDD